MSPELALRHLLSIDDLGRDGIVEVLHRAESFAEISERAIPKVPALRGRTVATVFFESSTRTRLSFETAAKRLSADTMTFSPATSSLQKGESVRDTVETIDAMGVDAMIVRHAAAGVPQQISGWVNASVVNAGDGAHEHPTQALLDCFTIKEALSERNGKALEDLSGVRVAIAGDIRHSRVARSNVKALTMLGADVVLVAPSTLQPSSCEDWPVRIAHDLDEVLSKVDVIYLLRLQSERMKEAYLPNLAEYRERFGMTDSRAATLGDDVVIMHPGPMNRGVEIDAGAASHPNSLITRQVKNGVAVRMAVLFTLLGARGPVNMASETDERA